MYRENFNCLVMRPHNNFANIVTELLKGTSFIYNVNEVIFPLFWTSEFFEELYRTQFELDQGRSYFFEVIKFWIIQRKEEKTGKVRTVLGADITTDSKLSMVRDKLMKVYPNTMPEIPFIFLDMNFSDDWLGSNPLNKTKEELAKDIGAIISDLPFNKLEGSRTFGPKIYNWAMESASGFESWLPGRGDSGWSGQPFVYSSTPSTADKGFKLSFDENGNIIHRPVFFDDSLGLEYGVASGGAGGESKYQITQSYNETSSPSVVGNKGTI